MKTLAEFKRALKLGSVWETRHRSGRHWPERPVVTVGSKKVGFECENGTVSYLHFPKASDYSFDDGWAQLSIEDEGTKTKYALLKYKLIEKS